MKVVQLFKIVQVMLARLCKEEVTSI